MLRHCFEYDMYFGIAVFHQSTIVNYFSQLAPWSAVAQWWNAGPAIQWARVRIPFATVLEIGHFRSLHWRPCWLSCINEYLAIDSGGNVSDLVLAHNCCLARILPGEAELVSEWTGLSGRAKSVKSFDRSNGLDTALYKNYLYLFICFVHTRNSFYNPTWCDVFTIYMLYSLIETYHVQRLSHACVIALWQRLFAKWERHFQFSNNAIFDVK